MELEELQSTDNDREDRERLKGKNYDKKFRHCVYNIREIGGLTYGIINLYVLYKYLSLFDD